MGAWLLSFQLVNAAHGMVEEGDALLEKTTRRVKRSHGTHSCQYRFLRMQFAICMNIDAGASGVSEYQHGVFLEEKGRYAEAAESLMIAHSACVAHFGPDHLCPLSISAKRG